MQYQEYIIFLHSKICCCFFSCSILEIFYSTGKMHYRYLRNNDGIAPQFCVVLLVFIQYFNMLHLFGCAGLSFVLLAALMRILFDIETKRLNKLRTTRAKFYRQLVSISAANRIDVNLITLDSTVKL